MSDNSGRCESCDCDYCDEMPISVELELMTDREAALCILTRVAAELVRLDGLPVPDDDEFRPTGKRELRRICEHTHRRGREIVKAIKLLRKDAK